MTWTPRGLDPSPMLCCSHPTEGPHPRTNFEHPEKCQKSVKTVSKQCRASVSQGPTRENP
eukprot:7138541-Pyramimonas_sp.AAC.1